jgi:hypothetical protein
MSPAFFFSHPQFLYFLLQSVLQTRRHSMHPVWLTVTDHEPKQRLHIPECGIDQTHLFPLSFEMPVNRVGVLSSRVTADMGDVKADSLRGFFDQQHHMLACHPVGHFDW